MSIQENVQIVEGFLCSNGRGDMQGLLALSTRRY